MTRLVGTFASAVALVVGACPARAHAWQWPVEGEVITPYRNGDDPYAAGQHRGIDIAAELGAPVRAAAGGTVRYSGTAGSSGLTVSIRTADGSFDTSYLHLGSIEVRQGQAVQAGERIGAVGTTGRRSAGAPHLHFGVREAGSRHAYRDPLEFLPPRAVRSPEPDSPRGAPAPAPAPVPSAPAPEPVAPPLPPPAPDHVPGRRRVPAGRRARPGRAPAGQRLPGHAGAGQGVPAESWFEGALPRSADAAVRTPHPLPPTMHEPLGSGRLGAPRQGLDVPPAATPHPPRPPGRAPHGGRPPVAAGGPDLGWALACLGLLLAAACVGVKPDRKRGAEDRSVGAAGRMRAAAAALLHARGR